MSCANVYYYNEPGNLDLKIKGRGSWSFPFTVYDTDGVTPFDLTGYTAYCDFVSNDGSYTLIDSCTTDIPTPTDGTIYLSLTATETAALPVDTPMFYDVFIDKAPFDGANRRSFVQGTVVVQRGYTAL